MRSSFATGLLGGLVGCTLVLTVLALILAPSFLPGGSRAHAASLNQAGSPQGNPPSAPTPNPEGPGVILGPAGAPTGTVTAGGPVQFAAPPASAPAATLADRAFTYQGMLRLAGAPVNGGCEFQFTLWDDAAAGIQLGVTQTLTATVTSGQFTAILNGANQFGGTAFDGRAAWLEPSVRCPAGSGAYTPLTPRQALTAAPLASGLAPHATMRAGNTYSGFPSMTVEAPPEVWSNPMGLQVRAGAPSAYLGTFDPVAVWADSGAGVGVWGSTSTGYAIMGTSSGSGYAGYFSGDVLVSGKLTVPRFHVVQAINTVGPLPRTSGAFTTYGGTLVLFFSGSGWRNPAASAQFIGMMVKLDGGFIDNTAVYANQPDQHLAFVAKQLVLTSIPAGSHTISLEAINANTYSDGFDIYTVTVMELPY